MTEIRGLTQGGNRLEHSFLRYHSHGHRIWTTSSQTTKWYTWKVFSNWKKIDCFELLEFLEPLYFWVFQNDLIFHWLNIDWFLQRNPFILTISHYYFSKNLYGRVGTELRQRSTMQCQCDCLCEWWSQMIFCRKNLWPFILDVYISFVFSVCDVNLSFIMWLLPLVVRAEMFLKCHHSCDGKG